MTRSTKLNNFTITVPTLAQSHSHVYTSIFCFILLFTSSSPYRKDQFAVSYFSTSLIVLIQVYNWEIRHHSLVCCCGLACWHILYIYTVAVFIIIGRPMEQSTVSRLQLNRSWTVRTISSHEKWGFFSSFLPWKSFADRGEGNRNGMHAEIFVSWIVQL